MEFSVVVIIPILALGKVFELMGALEAKITAEGEAEAKAFKEFFEWSCPFILCEFSLLLDVRN